MDEMLASFRDFPINRSSPSLGSFNIADGRYVGILKVSLCSQNLLSPHSDTNARVPVFRTFPTTNSRNEAYSRIAMAVPTASNDAVAYGANFVSPYQSISFGGNLRHGTDVANAAAEFDSNVGVRMIQVYSIGPTKANSNDCSSFPARKNGQSNATIGGISRILTALDSIERDPDGVGAVNMSIVFRQSSCDRDRSAPFGLCTQRVGQSQVNALREKGIPLVVGLNNSDIGKAEETWPACLDNVIKVGAANDNRDLVNGGIGIGGMDVDFYAKNSVSANGGRSGNSMAAPRIATALARLKDAVPSSTIDQRIKSLNQADSRTNNYRFNRVDYRRRNVESGDIPDAIEILESLVLGNTQSIKFEDPGVYGPAFGGNTAFVDFEIDFNNLVGQSSKIDRFSKQSISLKSNSPVRDVVVTYDGKTSIGSATIQIRVNGIFAHYAVVRGTQTVSAVLNRNLFREGVNQIQIRPALVQSTNWGISNIKADFHPVIELSVGQTDTNEYGYLQAEKRYTGLRTAFNLPTQVNSDYSLSVTGWDIDLSDENEVFLNSNSIGFLTKSSTNGSYSRRDKFILRSDILQQGQNVIEFVQRRPSSTWNGLEAEKWAVKDILVEPFSGSNASVVSPILLLLLDE